MHYSTKITKLANVLLAFGLTIVTQFSAAGSGHALDLELPFAPEQRASVVVLSPTGGTALLCSATGVQTVTEAILSSSCDRCRTICARNCTSYACRVCIRSIKCGPFVQACVITRPHS